MNTQEQAIATVTVSLGCFPVETRGRSSLHPGAGSVANPHPEFKIGVGML
jgi:hypothetical protein